MQRPREFRQLKHVDLEVVAKAEPMLQMVKAEGQMVILDLRKHLLIQQTDREGRPQVGKRGAFA